MIDDKPSAAATSEAATELKELEELLKNLPQIIEELEKEQKITPRTAR